MNILNEGIKFLLCRFIDAKKKRDNNIDKFINDEHGIMNNVSRF